MHSNRRRRRRGRWEGRKVSREEGRICVRAFTCGGAGTLPFIAYV